MKELLTVAAILALPCAGASAQTPVSVSFDAIPGVVPMPNTPGVAVPASAQLHTQLQASTGAVFRSASGVAYVPVVLATPVPSEPAAIGGANASGELDYQAVVVVEFFLPGSPSSKAVTDFVSVVSDLAPIKPLTGADELLTLQAFGLDGSLLGSAQTLDDLGGETLSVSFPGIHSIRLIEEGSTNAWDDLSFNPVTCDATAAAVETVRVGSPPNPVAFLPGVSSSPVIGATWDPVVDHTTFVTDAITDFALISGGPANLSLGLQGTLLCNPAVAPFLLVGAPSPGAPFAILVPDECGFVGVSICVQAGSFDSSFASHLANALDITIGTD